MGATRVAQTAVFLRLDRRRAVDAVRGGVAGRLARRAAQRHGRDGRGGTARGGYQLGRVRVLRRVRRRRILLLRAVHRRGVHRSIRVRQRRQTVDGATESVAGRATTRARHAPRAARGGSPGSFARREGATRVREMDSISDVSRRGVDGDVRRRRAHDDESFPRRRRVGLGAEFRGRHLRRVLPGRGGDQSGGGASALAILAQSMERVRARARARVRGDGVHATGTMAGTARSTVSVFSSLSRRSVRPLASDPVRPDDPRGAVRALHHRADGDLGLRVRRHRHAGVSPGQARTESQQGRELRDVPERVPRALPVPHRRGMARIHARRRRHRTGLRARP